MVGGRMMADIISTLSQDLQTMFWTVQLVVDGYAVVKFTSWMGDDKNDETRLQFEICRREATVSGPHSPLRSSVGV